MGLALGSELAPTTDTLVFIEQKSLAQRSLMSRYDRGILEKRELPCSLSLSYFFEAERKPRPVATPGEVSTKDEISLSQGHARCRASASGSGLLGSVLQ
jgi:hypothetical protein